VRSTTTALVIGLFTDYFTGGVIGVFTFARILTAFLVGETAHFVDLRKNIFIFLFVWASLLVSNAVAGVFLSFTIDFNFSMDLLFFQPLLTAAAGMLLAWPTRMKRLLDVF
jgi:cell shape-determining protein MreD